MDELLKDFSDRARQSVPADLPVDEWIKVYNKKFAEFVINECIDICEQGTQTQMTSAGVATHIRQRFGVE